MFKKKTDFHLSTTDGVTNVLQGIFGEGRELDTPFSDLDQTFSMDEDTSFLAMGLKSSAVSGLSSKISKAFCV